MKDLEVASKYYTPEIDEFYVGFQYEHYSEKCDCWLKCFYGTMYDQRSKPLDELFLEKERVKYLDQTDIEELGWENQEVHTDEFITFKKGKFRIDLHSNIVVIYKADHWSVFQGIIKNKSELKKLMKQLNIEGNED